MFGPIQVKRMFQLSKLDTVDKAVARLLEFAEDPKDLSLVPVPHGPGCFPRPC